MKAVFACGCLTAFMVIVGVVLLLPGLCALVFGAGSLFSSSYDSGFTLFILFGLLVGFGGVMMIRAALRGQRRQLFCAELPGQCRKRRKCL